MAIKILTQELVDGLRAPTSTGKQQLIWDKRNPRFGILLSGRTPTKTYVVQGTLTHLVHDKPKYIERRVTIGRTQGYTLEKARQAAQAIFQQFDANLDPKVEARRRLLPQPASKADMTLQQVLDEYTKDSRLADNSVLHYTYMCETYLAAWLDRPLRSITRDDVLDRHKAIPKEVVDGKYAAANGHRTNGQYTANESLATFKMLYNHAARRIDELPTNPCSILYNPNKGGHDWFRRARRKTSIKLDQLAPFYAATMALDNELHRDAIRLLLFTGARRSTILGLRRFEVDSTERKIVIAAERMKSKDHEDFELPLPDFTYNILAERLKLYDGDLVFRSPYFTSGEGYINDLSRPLKIIAEDTGITICCNDLRRNFVTVAESLELSPYVIKALMHHSTGNDVTAGYIVRQLERRRTAMQQITDKLRTLCGIETKPNRRPSNVIKLPKRKAA
jgi:integrase